MKAKAIRGFMLAGVLVVQGLLSGCWDSKELADEAFVTGIGVDYADGMFIVSLQLLDFAAIAKSESESPAPPNVWIGTGKGKSLHAAISSLAISAQVELSLEQLKVVVVREPAMPKMVEILDALNRVRVSRYTSWIFGTKEKINDLFASDAFFEQSQLASLMYDPGLLFRQDSMFQPMTMQQFVANYNESSETALLPSVAINNRAWRKRKTKMHMEQINGLFAFKDKRKPVFFSVGEARGLQWANKHFNRDVLTVNSSNGVASITVRNLKVRRKVEMRGDRPILKLDIQVRSSLNEVGPEIDRSTIIENAKNQIKQEVLSAYENGVKKEVDLYNFEEILYRYHLKTWKKLSKHHWKPEEKELQVNIRFGLKYSGVFELR
ncbi:Ger(x)C family spore germination protein [Paenibacillus rhizovicinus]|uniref:Ger(X)C family spore germination protein n=1 Tax=Paenibacillus rhizovicinus TaxID=2704463 RepID=A0A6C0P6F9_9BACL|nr:Ger(x)C family spore germination protein [Paenibacillus rhizovicinus]QHW34099.1 Ger(x)C family spore germination protein [Paenibacillus rhizovicinus]